MKQFQNINLFDLLDIAIPPNTKGQPHNQQISEYLHDHLQRIRGLSASQIAYADPWKEDHSTLDTSLYLGIQWRNGFERGILDQALDRLDSLVYRDLPLIMENAIDPHRLQISYGQHAISLSTVPEFYLDHNNAMEAYFLQSEAWERYGSESNTPVHGSSEMERLVRDAKALGYVDAEEKTETLPWSVIRLPFKSNLSISDRDLPSGDLP